MCYFFICKNPVVYDDILLKFLDVFGTKPYPLFIVGVIGNQGPHPVQEVSARHFGSSSTNEPEVKAAGGVFGLPRDITDDTTIPPETQTQRLTPGPPVFTVSSMLPTTETSMIQGG